MQRVHRAASIGQTGRFPRPRFACSPSWPIVLALSIPVVVQKLANYDQEPAYLGPADHAQACREMFAKERGIVDRMGLTRGGS